jgi:hypothetical protein
MEVGGPVVVVIVESTGEGRRHCFSQWSLSGTDARKKSQGQRYLTQGSSSLRNWRLQSLQPSRRYAVDLAPSGVGLALNPALGYHFGDDLFAGWE